MVTINGDTMVWNDNVYKSDIVMSTIRPYVNAMGKAVPKHILRRVNEQGEPELHVNPEPYIRFLMEEPNPWMTGQKYREWMAACLKINNHAFALIARDENGLPIGLYPIAAVTAVSEYDAAGTLYIRFFMRNGKNFLFPYTDLIHLRGDPSTGGDFWGGSKVEQLVPLLEQIGTIDRGIVNAIKNGAIIRWLLRFTNNLNPEHLKERAKEFAEQFLSTESGFGVAATDSKSEAIQIKPNDYVPDAEYTDIVIKRFRSTFNTNEKIVMSSYTDDEWNSYYEAQVEPDVIQWGEEHTRKLFSRKKRSYGNYLMLESSNLTTASMQAKLDLKEMVDRGAMTPNEWRETFNLAPVPGGDKLIRRLDTAEVKEQEVLNNAKN